MYYLDTNTCIYFLNGKYLSVRDRILATAPGRIAIPSVVKAQLLFGAAKSTRKDENLYKVEAFLSPFEIVPFENSMTYVYADLRFELERKGQPIGPNDLFIASIALARDGVLVTNNSLGFGKISGLKLENWVEARTDSPGGQS